MLRHFHSRFERRVIELLNLWGRQFLEADRADGGDDMVHDLIMIASGRHRFNVPEIFRFPDFQPLGHGDLFRRLICSGVQLHRRGLELLEDFLLRLAEKGALDLLPRSRVPAYRYPGFPVFVLLPVLRDGLFSDGSGSLGTSFC